MVEAEEVTNITSNVKARFTKVGLSLENVSVMDPRHPLFYTEITFRSERTYIFYGRSKSNRQTDLSILAANIFYRIQTLHVSLRVLEADQSVWSQASPSNPATVPYSSRAFSKFKLFLSVLQYTEDI